MRSLALTSLAGLSLMLPQAASAASDSLQTARASTSSLALAAPIHGAKPGGGMPMGGMKMGGGMQGGGMKMGGAKMGGGHMPRPPMMRMGGNRWGGKIDNRWVGGMRAPGGYNGYRQLNRGTRLPSYWVQPSFFIGNFGSYGLSQPSIGYGWSRYYDDAVLSDRSGVVYDSVRNVDWDRYDQGYQAGYTDGSATYDNDVLTGDDRVAGTYDGAWQGGYRNDGSYQGQWQGTYVDENGRAYQGQYDGTYYGSADGGAVDSGVDYAAPDGAPHWSDGRDYDQRDYDQRGYDPRGYDDRNDELAYLQRCRESSGIGGAVVGGAIGALAGNRIAGRGSRLGGTLIGGGIGAVAGAAIDQGSDRCRKLLKKYGGRPAPVPPQQYRPAPPPRGPQYAPQYPAQPNVVYPNGWQGGYYYAQPAVTTVVIQSAPVTTTTTTTTTYYEEQAVRTHKASKRLTKPASKWRPKPSKPSCRCD